MSETTDTTEVTTSDPDAVELDPQATETEATEETPDDAPESIGTEGKSNREAAKWRTKFRDAETQIAAMTEQVSTLQRQLVDQAIAKRIADPSDFWTQADVADLLAEDGTLDPALIDAKVAEVLAAKPHWMKRASAAAPTSDVGTGKISNDATKTFVDAFKPRN